MVKLFAACLRREPALSVDGNKVVVVGRSSCSDKRLDGPALWAAKESDDKLAEWRVYEHTPANRSTLGIASRRSSREP